jgi:hypothetical protein
VSYKAVQLDNVAKIELQDAQDAETLKAIKELL